MPGGSERPTVAAPAWRDEPGPLRWRVLVVLLAAASVVPFAHGFVVLLSSSIPTWFLAALLVMLTGANACILQLPPYRFLHFTSGLVVFAAFFVVGPAVLALTLLSIAATEVLRRIPWIARRFDPLPLGGTPAEYVVPAATIAIALGMVDLRTRSLGLSFPYSAVDPAAEARLLAILAVVYVAILATFELSVVLRFGVRPCSVLPSRGPICSATPSPRWSARPSCRRWPESTGPIPRGRCSRSRGRSGRSASSRSRRSWCAGD